MFHILRRLSEDTEAYSSAEAGSKLHSCRAPSSPMAVHKWSLETGSLKPEHHRWKSGVRRACRARSALYVWPRFGVFEALLAAVCGTNHQPTRVWLARRTLDFSENYRLQTLWKPFVTVNNLPILKGLSAPPTAPARQHRAPACFLSLEAAAGDRLKCKSPSLPWKFLLAASESHEEARWLDDDHSLGR